VRFSFRTKLKAAGDLADNFGMRNTIAQNFTALTAGLLPCERRRGNRILVHMPVRISGQGLLDKVSQDGTCTDISEAGIGFETDADLYVGEIVDLEFPRHDGDPFRFQARLLYKMGNRYGAYLLSPGS
jgi:hypothetical protein